MNTQRGFTLLEAMVALTIFATVGISLYAWLSNSMGHFIRAEAVFAEQNVLPNTLARIRTIKPRDGAQGTFLQSGFKVHWSTTQVAPYKPVLSAAGAVGNFDVALFDVAIVFEKDSKRSAEYVARVEGSKLVRVPAELQELKQQGL